MRSPAADSITALILAGGEGRRMGGLDKGWVEYKGLPLVRWVLAIARNACSDVIICANRSHDRYAQLGVPLVNDLTTGFQGPVAGILAGAAACSRDWLWILPVDCPRADPRLLRKLVASANRTGASIAVAHDGARDQPLFMLLNRAAQARLLNYYLGGGRSVRGWLQTQVFVRTDCRQLGASFTNVNEPQDLEAGAQTGTSLGMRPGVDSAA